MKFRVSVGGAEWRKGAKRYTQKAATFYVTKVSWAEGPGMQLAKFWYGDAERAITFSKATADSIAEQLRTRWGMISVGVEGVL